MKMDYSWLMIGFFALEKEVFYTNGKKLLKVKGHKKMLGAQKGAIRIILNSLFFLITEGICEKH